MTTYRDEDGYPTCEALDIIRTWPVERGWEDLMAFIKDIWWAPDWGWRETIQEKDFYPTAILYQKHYHLSTGGWSGNEEIIQAMQENFLFFQGCWEQSRSGGHYIFTLGVPQNGNAT